MFIVHLQKCFIIFLLKKMKFSMTKVDRFYQKNDTYTVISISVSFEHTSIKKNSLLSFRSVFIFALS